MKEDLKKLGLTEGEASVFLTLVKLGSSTVGPIVKKSGVSYSKVYEVLNRLLKKGLINYITKESTKYFQAVEPNRIIDYLQEEQKEVNKKIKLFNVILPKLENFSKTSPIKEDAQIFIGFKGVMSAYETMLENHDKKEKMLFFYIPDKLSIETASLFYKQAFHLYKRIGLKLKGISNTTFRNTKFLKKHPKFIELRFVNFPLPSTMDVYKDKVLITSWREQTIAYLINSKEIADNYREYFNQVWAKAKK